MVQKTKIYRFPNATLVQFSGSYGPTGHSLLKGGKELEELKTLISDSTFKKLGSWTTRIYEASAGELELVHSTWSQDLVSYIPLEDDPLTEDQSLRELDEETYLKLSPGFQKLYRKKLADPVELRQPVDFELIESPIALTEDALLGKELPTALHGAVEPLRERARRKHSYYSYGDDGPRPDLRRVLPLNIDSEELMHLIFQLSKTVVGASNCGATVTLRDYYASTPQLEISFLASTYTGAMTKRLDKKANGQPYADRRGRMVKDLPKTVGQAIVTTGDIWKWWEAIEGNQLSDGEKLEAIQALIRRLWLSETAV